VILGELRFRFFLGPTLILLHRSVQRCLLNGGFLLLSSLYGGGDRFLVVDRMVHTRVIRSVEVAIQELLHGQILV